MTFGDGGRGAGSLKLFLLLSDAKGEKAGLGGAADAEEGTGEGVARETGAVCVEVERARGGADPDEPPVTGNRLRSSSTGNSRCRWTSFRRPSSK
jgi:hypothetical protein